MTQLSSPHRTLGRTLRGWTMLHAGDAVKGWSVHRALSTLRRLENASTDEVARFQTERLHALIDDAYRNVPFYNSLWRRAGVEPDDIKTTADLCRLPKVTKADLVAAGKDTRNARFSPSELLRGKSSGSTGEPFVYLKDKAHHSWFIAGAMHAWRTAGWRPGDPWVRVQFRGDLSLRARIEDRLFGCLYMPIDALDPSFMLNFARRIERFRPTLIRGYAGALYVFARFLLENPQISLRPLGVSTTGDTLYPHYREAIEAAFGCRVLDAYGGEGLAIANQLADGSYYVLPSVHVDLEHGDAPETARMVVTSLTNHGMPLIRYDIADCAVCAPFSAPAALPWQRLAGIAGRDTDIVVTPRGRHLVCHHFNNIIREHPWVEQFQVRQSAQDSVTVLLMPHRGAPPTDVEQAAITGALQHLTGGDATVSVSLVESIPLPKSGKRRYIISEISKP